jgi:hypothetical protein
MKKYILTITVLLFIAFTAFSQAQKLNVPLSKPGASFTLKAGLIYGSINVIGYTGKEVLIEAEQRKTEHYTDSKEKGGMKRINGSSGFELEVEEKDNVVTVRAPGWMKAITLTIKVPAGISRLEVSTINNGYISIANVNGDIEVKNVNGEITFKNVSGSIIATTINGDIKGDLKSHKAGSPLAFTTLNGNVDVTFPANFKADMKMKSDRGEIYTDFELDATTQQVKKSTDEGSYKIKLENWVRGKINGGGAEVLMKNMNGNIYVRKAK